MFHHVSVDAALFGEGPFYPCLEFPPRVVLVQSTWLQDAPKTSGLTSLPTIQATLRQY
jgi:hypothetical protein